MKRLVLMSIPAMLMLIGFFSCDKSTGDKVKIVNMTIYPETWPGRSFLSEAWYDALVFSESDDNQKQTLSNTIIEGLDFDYERGYEYTFKANKVWMSNPPMDVSSIKYIFVGSLTKKRVIIENSEEEIELFVSSELVKYFPMFPIEYVNEIPQDYDALFCVDKNTNRNYVLKEIEGFNYERGYEYTLSVKKIIQAQPYLERYVLLNIKDKHE